MQRTLFLLLLLAQLGLGLSGGAEQGVPFVLPPREALAKLRSAAIFTPKGAMIAELYPEDAPWHVANFKYLADKGFYRGGLTFHVFYPGYILQGGATIKNPSYGPGYTLPPEFSKHRHERGSLGMARLPDSANPERRSSGGQFHILLIESPTMNASYTIFGKVVKGLDVLDRLRAGDRINDIKVFVRR